MGRDHRELHGGVSRQPQSPADLAREWAHALATTVQVPASLPDIRRDLQDLSERLVAALARPSVDTQAASDVGARLVAAGFTGGQSLSRTVELLGQALPRAAGDTASGSGCGRIIELLGALATGYTWALRNHVLDQQEAIKQGLALAWQEVERELRASEARFREMFDSSPMGIVISERDGPMVQTNPSFSEILGYPPGELLGRPLSELFSTADRLMVQERYQDLLTGRTSRFRARCALRRADGEIAWVHLAASRLPDTEQAPQYLATMINDIADVHLLERRLNYQTLHDLQTGLPNRQYFTTHLEKVLGQLDPAAVVTLLHLDLDGFSAINDGFGHNAGDQLLDVVARRLERVIAGQHAMVARLGADEYAILVEPGDSVLDAGTLAEIVNAGLTEPCHLDEIGTVVTATIGVVQRPAVGSTPEGLMRAAGATLRRLRGKSKRQWQLFDPDIDAAERTALRLAATMPGALDNGELRVTYQPVVRLDCRWPVGIEAALCWQHPQLGVLPNEQCARAAEGTGAVHAIGQWLLRTAAEQAVSWRQRIGGGVPPVVVNLTPSQAQDLDLVARVRAVLEQTGVAPADLELRAPAAAIRTDTGEYAGEGGALAEDNLRVLASLGVRTGLYDFGGGIGGLRCLADLSICAVRIARPVSQQVANDPSRILSQAAQALVHIVRAAGIDVVAFPVDSEEQAACWPWIGANWGVGALYGRPGPPHDIELRLRRS
ncbi:MAG: putative bifunctional diguanylate cyclase/phosphodiesterase [Pseudonocardiaceae bacterium]